MTKTKLTPYFKIISSLSIAFSLVACGGGGGGGDITPATVADNLLLQYSGNKDSAQLDLSNLGQFSEMLLDLTAEDSELIPFSAQDTYLSYEDLPSANAINTFLLNKSTKIYLEKMQESEITQSPIAKTVTEEECDNGFMETENFINDKTGIGEITLSYSNCYNDGVTINGKVTSYFYSWNATFSYPTSYIMIYQGFKVTNAYDKYAELNGKLKVTGNRSCFQIKNINLLSKSSDPELNYFIDNVIEDKQCTNGEGNGIPTDLFVGRIYIAQHGWVDIKNSSPLLIADNGNLYEGTLRLSSESSHAILEGINNKGYPITALSIDSNDDDVYEYTIHLPSRYLRGNGIANDLNDSDNDGMWNSWELYYYLNPDIDDSTQDADDDGFSNKEEFLGATNPIDHFETPYLIISLALEQSYDIAYSESDPIDSLTLPITLQGGFYFGLYGLMNEFQNVTYRLTLDPDYDWTVSDAEHCAIQETEILELVCENLDLTQLITDSSQNIGNLILTRQEGISDYTFTTESTLESENTTLPLQEDSIQISFYPH